MPGAMENKWLSDFVDVIAPFYPLWQSMRVSGAAINTNGGWLNIAMHMELLEGKPESRISSFVPPDFLHYRLDYPLPATRDLVIDTVRNRFLTIDAKKDGGDGQERIFLSIQAWPRRKRRRARKPVVVE